MSYRFPIYVGDRVALAPHLDLWMAGLRFGTVTDVMVNEEGVRYYHVLYSAPDRSVWLSGEDLLGAVPRGAMPSTSFEDNRPPQPRRKRVLPGWADTERRDPGNNARCIRFGERTCSGLCPRHDPEGYAEHMARHTPQSIMKESF